MQPTSVVLVRLGASMSKQPLFKVVFMSQGQVYEIYARSVGHGELFGFVEVEELVFGERTTVVVDPSEEKIKSEFENVKRVFGGGGSVGNSQESNAAPAPPRMLVGPGVEQT